MDQRQRGDACILVSCPDRPGIVSAVSTFLFDHGANIVELDQHTDVRDDTYFMRVEFDADPPSLRGIKRDFQSVARRFAMNWHIAKGDRKKQIIIFVSKEDHCLMELLWQWRSKNLPVNLVGVVSNHPDHEETVGSFGLPYYYVPVHADEKKQSEKRALAIIDGVDGGVDLIVLARYMQILSPDFVARFPNTIMNIHHSFLPAFIGGRPYDQAYERGVKIIGATAHYVTEELDAGPIVEQDIARVNHRDTVTDMKHVGRTIERTVLARAVRWHVEDRILVHGNKTVVFNGR